MNFQPSGTPPDRWSSSIVTFRDPPEPWLAPPGGAPPVGEDEGGVVVCCSCPWCWAGADAASATSARTAQPRSVFDAAVMVTSILSAV
ncbi:MAG: hypothetical protein DMD87_14205 [Candidatus Rokuibacteriota bacterium]|nr:MAG: hypothetical protein DMD87_14205 [Candidatus Rokubacteria bacterium]